MLMRDFARHLKELEAVSSRLTMTELLARLFTQLSRDEIAPACYLMQGKLVPQYVSLEFNLSTKLVLRALAKLAPAQAASQVDLFGTSDTPTTSQVELLYKQQGDIGSTAEAVTVDHDPTHHLELLEVFAQLTDIATDEGPGSQDRKVSAVTALFTSLDSLSNRYIARIIIGKLRLGFSTMTMIDALSWTKQHNKSDSEVLEDAYNKQADIGALAVTYLTQGRAGLASYQVKTGTPIIPALCQRLNTSQEIIAKMHQVIVEPKYDGMRVQIHLNRTPTGHQLTVFTRNLENVSLTFPELRSAQTALHCRSCILDGEVIGYHPITGELLAFQETSTRRRKHDIAQQAEAIPIRCFVFDLIELDGRSLVDTPLQERKKLLTNIISPNEVYFPTDYIITADPQQVRTYHEQQLLAGLEGAVIKQIDSPYRGGRKGWSWVKIKEHEGHSGKLSDTLDCVVMGYYQGRGKRTSLGLGAILVGILKPETDQIVTIAKIGTGLSDELIQQLTEKLNQLATPTAPAQFVVSKELTPDVWVTPELVIEVAADELTTSPLHTAGLGLRFPRLIKVRTDKTWQEATTISELEQIKVES